MKKGEIIHVALTLARRVQRCTRVCGAARGAPVNERRMLNAAENRADWLTHGRTYDEQRFSPLAASIRAT